MKKICFVVTTRGNYGKLKSVVRAVEKYPDMRVQVVTGGEFLLTDIDVVTDIEVPFILEGDTLISMAKSAGYALGGFAMAFDHLFPDIVVVVGDRFDILPITMAAVYQNIPVAHIEGGEVSGALDESIRHAVTKLSHLHFPATEDAAERIKRLGEDPDTIFPAGATSLDVMAEYVESKPYLGKYLVYLYHPVSTAHNIRYEDEILDVVKQFPHIHCYMVVPHVEPGHISLLEKYRKVIGSNRTVLGSLPIEKFTPLLKHAKCLIGNSSAGVREAGFLGTPVVNIGNRQDTRYRGANVIDVPCEAGAIVEAVNLQLEHGPYESDYYYGDGTAGEKIAKVLSEGNPTIQKRITY